MRAGELDPNVDTKNLDSTFGEGEVYVLPMSFAQQRLWFLDQFEPESPFYNIPSGVRFKGTLNLAAFEKAVNEIIHRHETLRTTFRAVENEPCQIVHPFNERTFPIIDISHLPSSQITARVMNLARKEAATPFNLQQGPLLRVTIIRAAENDHVILFTMHHIISDGWSMGVFVREITVLYDAFIKGNRSPLPALPIQYGDFAEWQQTYITGEVLERQLHFWKSQLAGTLPILELPTDRPRPSVQTMVGANEEMIISTETTRAIRDVARQHGVTLFMTLLAAFKVLLHRYTSLDDIVVGSPIANRNRAEIEPLIGFFVNTLVLRSDLSGNPSFAELLKQIKKNTLDAYDHQDIPFERLVEVLQPQRDMAHSPLFQVMFILQNTPTNVDIEFSDVSLEMLDIDAGTSTFDLTLMVSESPNSFSVSAEYNTDLFNASTIKRLLRHFEMLLQAIAADASLSISDLTILPADEKESILRHWNDFDRQYDLNTCIHRLFEEQAARTPSSVAVVFENQILTYNELNRKANKLAAHLKNLGIGPDIKVSICLDKCIDLPIAVLGTLKAGGAYVPVDPTYPEDRILYMLQNSEATAVLSHKKYAPILSQQDSLIFYLDEQWPQIEGLSSENPQEYPDADNLAYMIYTSGSTGKAKGTMVAHKSIVNAYRAWEEDYHLRNGVNSHLQMASFSFDVFAGDFVRALCSGGKLVLTPRDHLLEADKLFDLMRREKVNCAEFVPAVLRNLISYLDETEIKLDFMKTLIAGSDIWYVKEYKAFLNYCEPDTRLINSFGLTEAAVDSTFFEGDLSEYAQERLVPIGRPFPNTRIFIVDEYLNLAPVGIPGELWVAGPNLARGYFGRPDLTAEKFIPNPFSDRPGERVYRTGDLARWLADGNIEFLGRIDHQIKIRGFRVELGEIESVLEKHPDVHHAVVIAREDIPGNKQLVGYVTVNDHTQPESADIRAFLKEYVPEYMVPSAIMILNSFPLTPNGKVDRKALPSPDQSVYSLAETYREPRTDSEIKLAAIWCHVLKLPRVGAEDNFFAIGGHSLLATQVMSRIRQIFHIDFPLRKLFEYVTIADLAQAIDRAIVGTTTEMPPMTKMPLDVEPVLSFAQERLWFLDQLEPDTPFYNIPDAIRIRGPLDVKRLQNCIQAVEERHDVLRSTFHHINGKPVVKIHETAQLDFQIADLSDKSAQERETESKHLIERAVQQPFNLSTLPLLRVLLIRFDQEDFILVSTMHHIISDGWSSNLLVSEIALLYDAGESDAHTLLPPLSFQYQDFAYWQRQWLKGEILDRELEFWKNELAGSPPLLNLPTDRPRPVMQTPNGDFISFELTKELTQALNAISQSQGVTLFMTLLSAFYVLLHRYSDQDDINVGTPVANRTRSELENIIGFFVNTLVLRGNLANDPTFDELLQRVKKASLSAFAHQDVPFEKIVDALKIERNMGHSPLFQVMFALQNTPTQEVVTETNLSIAPITAHSGTSKFDLTLFMVEEGECLSGGFEFNTDLFDVLTIRHFISHYTALLEEIVAHPRLCIDSYKMMTPREERKLLLDWNGISSLPVISDNLVTVFESISLTMLLIWPGKVAVEYEDQKMTYRELNRRANRLAHHLITLGVRPDVLVGLAIHRSIDMVVAILGILKAGGAYVPLDPTYPQDRLAYMLDDSRVSVLITSENLLPILPATQARILCMDRDWPQIETLPEVNPKVMVDPENLAYMIYTSGSTGKPKGAMITHRGLINYLDWVYKSYPLDKGRGSIVHSTIAFDATVTAVFAPILVGKTIILLPDDADLEALSRMLKQKKDFSLIKITPAHLEMLSEQIKPAEAAGLTRSFVIGGENLTADQVRFWQENAPNTLLFNEYGPTETVVGCVVYEAHQWPGIGSVPIGNAITNTYVYVLDRHLQLVPPGAPGELYIGGEGVARGYHHRPDLTAERFLPNPFTRRPGARLYKTGDWVRYLNNGKLIYLGRIDSQVKIRGYRIELGEIDAVLQNHPAIKTAVTIDREDKLGDKRLVSYYTLIDEMDPDQQELYSLLQRQLPDYMVPSALICLPELPLTANGKINRSALPQPDFTQLKRNPYVAPRTPHEELLAAIWKQVLHLDHVGVFDNFFELGGHSLLATQLMSRIRDAFLVDVPLRCLFESPQIAGLSRAVQEFKRQELDQHIPPLVPVSREGNLPLSFAQQRLWFLDQLSPENPFYNIPAAIRIMGKLDVPAVEKSINEIVNRHESLRTIFLQEKGVPRQVIQPSRLVELKITDLSHLTPESREEEMQRLVTEDAMMPFRLDQGLLFRTGLIRLAAEEHVFLFTMHHIISDGWSTGVLMNEFGFLYQTFLLNNPATLPELKIQYADYAAWQRQWLVGDELNRQIDFWRRSIGVNPPVLDLPTDYPRPAIQTFNGDAVAFEIPPDVMQGLIEIGRNNDSTLFMMLASAFQVLLHRYTRQDEILIGTPIANRNYSETEALIGFFVNTLVLRAEFSPKLTFLDLLAQVREFTLDAYAHQDIPFEQLVDLLEPERDMSRSPLFQAMFVHQNAPMKMKGEISTALTMETVEAQVRSAKFDLTLVMAEVENGLQAELEYNRDLFAPETMRRMAEHLQLILGDIVLNPHQRVAEISLITEQEKNFLQAVSGSTRIELPREKTLHQQFESMVNRLPDKPAVYCEGTTLSYEQLNQQANRLAHYLRQAGVSSETIVGISMNRSVQLIVAVLAVLKAGGAYVPIDPLYPQERIEYIFHDAGIGILLTESSLEHLFTSYSSMVISLDHAQDQLEMLSVENPENKILPEQLAYIIYTSGSTGRPKGAMLQHLGAVNMALRLSRIYELQHEHRKLMFASFSFDASVEEIFVTLFSGATLYLAKKHDILPGPDLVEYINQHEITHITLPPSVLVILPENELRGLKSISSAGEACSKSIADRWAGNRLLVNAYGPTENSVCASAFQVREMPNRAAVPIGKALDNVKLYVLDDQLEETPVGIPGELCISGIGLARGYLHRPDLTADKFVPNPLGDPGERLYRTGDLVRYLPDGNIEYLGRIDDQVKLRGFRIELGEIEQVLLRHSALLQVVVLMQSLADAKSDRKLVAYYQVKPDSALTVDELRAMVKDSLPDYMMPQVFIRVDEIPLTVNGKVDRRRLPLPTLEDIGTTVEYVAPRNDEERDIAAVWSEVLGKPEIGIHDNFFDIGGHSLLATQVISRLRELLNLDIPVALIFEAPTVAEMNEKLHGLQTTELSTQLMPVSRDQELPLSFAQQRLWFLDQLEPESPLYNLPAAVRLKGELDFEAFKQSLEAIVERHESLRTIFAAQDGKPYQVISQTTSDLLKIEDWSAQSEEEHEKRLETFLTREFSKPFNLAVGPLIRVYLVRLRENESLFVVNMHHIISDGWSMNVFISEFAEFYVAFSKGEAPRLAELSIQYADYAFHQRERLSGDQLERHLDYWKRTLTGIPALLNLPTDHPRPPIQTYNGDTEAFSIDAEIIRKLHALTNEHDATLFMALLSAFQVLLHRYTGQNDVVVGVPIANRVNKQIEALIGFFVNTLVMRTDVSNGMTFRDILLEVRKTALNAFEHQDVPFEMVVDAVQPERNMSHSPLFQVMFVLQNIPAQPHNFSDVTIEPLEAETRLAKFDLTLTLAGGEDGFNGSFEYNTDLFERDAVQRMISHFVNILIAVSGSPDQPIHRIPLLAPDERSSMLVICGNENAEFGDERCIHELFEQQAALRPQAIAASFEDQHLTYAELNSRADRLALFLQKNHVGADDLVGLCVERSLDMVIGILGILKSGAGYVPIDPNYPADRKEFILADSGMKMLLTLEHILQELKNIETPTFCLDRDWNLAELEAEGDLTRTSTPQNIAYIIYTSGSTGKPKGVMVTHANVTRLFHATNEWYRFNEHDVWTLFHSHAFDFSVWELWGALFYGGRVVIVPYMVSRSPELFYKLLAQEKVTVLNQTPSAFRQLIQNEEMEGVSDLALRYVVFGGDKLELSSLKPWFTRHGYA
ncbi:MAG: amino acid adenylation domain-containing protein, partial [Calditrichaeota bacterium]